MLAGSPALDQGTTMRMPRIASVRMTLASLAAAATLVSMIGCETNIMKRDKGIRYMSEGKYQQAETKFTEVVTKSPTDYRTQFYLGVNHLKQGEPLQAQVALERSLALAPYNSDILEDILDNLAEAYLQQDRFDSLSAFLQKTATYYGETDDYVRQARFLARAGDIDGARTAFKKAGAFAHKHDPTPYIAAAEFFEQVGDVPSAIESLRYAYYVDWLDEVHSYTRIDAMLRKHGVVPGPTVANEPPKPELFR